MSFSLTAMLMVGLGGALGAVCRTWMSSAVESRSHRPWFFKGTFAVNLVACFLAGFVLRMGLHDVAYLLLSMGFLGGFSTLSTMNLEAAGFFQAQQYGKCFGYLALSYGSTLLIAGLGFALAGFML